MSMKIVEFLLNNLLPIFFAVLCLIAALKSIEIVKRSEVELMTKRRKEIERFESDTRKKYDEQCEKSRNQKKIKELKESRESEEDQESRKKKIS
mgnify:CR=1 FL=1